MPRAEMPVPTWTKLKTDPNGWRLKYINEGVELGEPLWLKGQTPSTEADANHLLFDDTRVDSIQVRSQGQNPIEIKISVIDSETGQDVGVWVPLSEAPYYGPGTKPVFPPKSVWAAWN